MALAKTNVTAYRTNQGEGNEEPLSISASAVVLGTNNEIKGIANHNGIDIIFNGSTKIYVSTDGRNFSETDLGFDVHDVIYSDSMKRFIAVGGGGDKPQVKTSIDAVTWEEADWGDFELESGSSNGVIRAILELGQSFLVIVTYNYTLGSTKSLLGFAVNVSFENNTYRYSEKISLTVRSYGRVYKGNNRIILRTESNYIITSESVKSTTYFPDGFVDGYFIAIVNQKLYRSINGVDYDLIGSCAITERDDVESVVKHDGYYYLLRKSAACRGKTLKEALSKEVEEYVAYDGGVKIPFKSVALLDGKIALLCDGYLLVLDMGGGSDPVTETIETLSAKAAMKKAMEYADGRIASLEERIAALENLNSGSQME